MPGLTPTTRRDFLSGRPIVHAVDGLLARPAEQPAREAALAAADGPLITVARRAMACRFEIVLPAQLPAAVAAGSAALDEIDGLEAQMTVYRDSSEVSRINTLAALMPVPVETRLFDLFETALRLHGETAGAFDMTAGALVKCWGFLRGPRRVPDPAELASVLERVGSRHVMLDPAARTIWFRSPGVELNLGAIGKGYAIDRAAALLRDSWGVTSGMLHAGGSSVYAMGTPAASGSDRAGWLVGIRHPYDADQRVAALRLSDAGLGTSGATIQYFEAQGRRFGHILDPRTGWPAQGQACVSVVAPTAAEADALSTALFILGPDAAQELCERRLDIGAVVVRAPSPDGPVQTTVHGRARELVEGAVAGNRE